MKANENTLAIWEQSFDDSNSIKSLEFFDKGFDRPHTKDEVETILKHCKLPWPNWKERQEFIPKYAISLPYVYGWEKGYMIVFTNGKRYLNGGRQHPYETEGERNEYTF